MVRLQQGLGNAGSRALVRNQLRNGDAWKHIQCDVLEEDRMQVRAPVSKICRNIGSSFQNTSESNAPNRGESFFGSLNFTPRKNSLSIGSIYSSFMKKKKN